MRIEESAMSSIELLAAVESMTQLQMHRAHRGQTPTVAAALAQNCNVQFNYYARLGDACMAHAKRLQERYWERRAEGASNSSCSGGGGGPARAGTMRIVRTNTGPAGQRNYLLIDSDGKMVGGGAD